MKNKYIVITFLCITYFLCSCNSKTYDRSEIEETLRKSIIEKAEKNIYEKPITVTSYIAKRSAGDIHDFYSEGDYWWPDPSNPDGPYIRKDGQSNPDNFTCHRKAMIRFSQIVGNLTSAYLLTREKKYSDAALKHVRAWFINPQTYMAPCLLYAQAIKGVTTGRGIGIIDTIHLIEVAQSLFRLEKAGALPEEDILGTKKWFSKYLKWMSSHPYGIDEMNAKNNHGTCWVMQASVFARYTGNLSIMNLCRERYKTILLPEQMKLNGSFPLELSRTKPYGYSLFNLDAMSTICMVLSNKENDLWSYTLDDGRNIMKGIDFMYPFVKDKSTWPYSHDIMYWDEWPISHPFLLFGYLHTGHKAFLSLWKQLDHFPKTEEVVRNLPVRNPIIWIE